MRSGIDWEIMSKEVVLQNPHDSCQNEHQPVTSELRFVTGVTIGRMLR